MFSFGFAELCVVGFAGVERLNMTACPDVIREVVKRGAEFLPENRPTMAEVYKRLTLVFKDMSTASLPVQKHMRGSGGSVSSSNVSTSNLSTSNLSTSNLSTSNLSKVSNLSTSNLPKLEEKNQHLEKEDEKQQKGKDKEEL